MVIYNPLINFRTFFGYFMLRGCKLQFESSFIVRPFITQVNSGQFNLFLQLGLISSIFSYYDFTSFHHPQQQSQDLSTIR